MAEVNYDGAVRQVRDWIASGAPEDLQKAEDVLEQLRSVYPKRLPYIAAEVALLLAKGATAACWLTMPCRSFIRRRDSLSCLR